MTLLGDKRNAAIRTLNDAFRGAGGLGGRVLFTAGVSNLGVEFSLLALGLVRLFDKFDPDNDPHGEHDFGSFEFGGETYFFKIDYYSPELDGGSEDPADPEKTTRVLTIMRADEY
jgi:hypothetical protein